MGDGHWAVITFMRDHREEHGISPDARFVFAFIAEKKRGGQETGSRHILRTVSLRIRETGCEDSGLPAAKGVEYGMRQAKPL